MDWNGFECREFLFEGHKARVILPHIKSEKPCLFIKTEYADAFPATEIMLLERGFYGAFIENDNRWGTNPDLERKARFVQALTAEYGLAPKCVPVGMSCGGLIAVKFAARFPELVSCLYLDAPVMNYMSCPCGFGVGNSLADNNREILDALGMSSISELICYREMPMDMLPQLVQSRIPAVLIAGDSDTVVPYTENGILLERAYRLNQIPLFHAIKPGCDHHPHGLEDPTPVVEFIMNHI